MNLCSNPVEIMVIMYLILLREKYYLTERYEWSDLPALFPSWQASAVMRMMDKAQERPTGWAVVGEGVVDLDKLEIQKF